VWASVQRAGTSADSVLAAGRLGGTVRLDLSGVDTTDPGLSTTEAGWQVVLATCARLVGYPDRPPPAGARLVPDVAQSLPRLSADRRTYTFTIRPGFRFSPPSNEPVTAATFKYSIERTLSPRLTAQARGTLDDIVGAKAFEQGKAEHIAGIHADGSTLTIRLTGASGSFLSRIAMPYFCAVPAGTPVDPKGVPTVPSAGPYHVTSFEPNRRVVLRRNPNYQGPRPHRLDELDIALNVGEPQALKDVEAGRADYVSLFETPRTETDRLARRYGPASSLGRSGRQQYFVNPFPAFRYLALNTSRPLFASARMRRAVNFAIDRRAIVAARISGPAYVPTDQYLPPTLPGFQDARIYPLDGPDLARARLLAGNRAGTAILYSGNDPVALKRASIIVKNLAAIGIDAHVKPFDSNVLYKRAATKGEPYDIADLGWTSDGYYDPFDFLNVLLDGSLPSTPDPAKFNDPVYRRRLQEAAKLTGPVRYRTYAKLDADLAGKAAPLAAMFYYARQDFFSARMGCQHQFGPDLVDLAALCIRGHTRP
jgi:peptide/nickel transport system substrate-binding protein